MVVAMHLECLNLAQDIKVMENSVNILQNPNDKVVIVIYQNYDIINGFVKGITPVITFTGGGQVSKHVLTAKTTVIQINGDYRYYQIDLTTNISYLDIKIETNTGYTDGYLNSGRFTRISFYILAKSKTGRYSLLSIGSHWIPFTNYEYYSEGEIIQEFPTAIPKDGDSAWFAKPCLGIENIIIPDQIVKFSITNIAPNPVYNNIITGISYDSEGINYFNYVGRALLIPRKVNNLIDIDPINVNDKFIQTSSRDVDITANYIIAGNGVFDAYSEDSSGIHVKVSTYEIECDEYIIR